MGQNTSTLNLENKESEVTMKYVSLTSHKMLNFPFSSLRFLKSEKQAKHLFEKSTGEEAKNLIRSERQKGGLTPPASVKVALGSKDEILLTSAGCGLFADVLTSCSYHYKLWTSSDEWWFCVIKRVACAIEMNVHKEAVRTMFVNHEEKKDITAPVGDLNIYSIDYSSVFDLITSEIRNSIKFRRSWMARRQISTPRRRCSKLLRKSQWCIPWSNISVMALGLDVESSGGNAWDSYRLDEINAQLENSKNTSWDLTKRASHLRRMVECCWRHVSEITGNLPRKSTQRMVESHIRLREGVLLR